MILVLLLGSSQAEMDLVVPAIRCKFCRGELAASVSTYPVKIHVSIRTGRLVICLILLESRDNSLSGLVRQPIEAYLT